MLQALNAGVIISKELLYKDVSPADRAAKGERAVLDFIDWELNGDPYFYEDRHLSPQPVGTPAQDGGEEHWIYYGTPKFSGKRLRVRPGGRHVSTENGVHTILAWSGSGTVGGHAVKGGDALADELLITHDAAIRPHVIENTGNEDLVLITFFGPDINPDVPALPAGGHRAPRPSPDRRGPSSGGPRSHASTGQDRGRPGPRHVAALGRAVNARDGRAGGAFGRPDPPRPRITGPRT